jgi:hypothetical protein
MRLIAMLALVGMIVGSHPASVMAEDAPNNQGKARTPAAARVGVSAPAPSLGQTSAAGLSAGANASPAAPTSAVYAAVTVAAKAQSSASPSAVRAGLTTRADTPRAAWERAVYAAPSLSAGSTASANRTSASLSVRVAEAVRSPGIGSGRARWSSVGAAATTGGGAKMTSLATAQAESHHAARLPRTILEERKAR